MSRAPGHIIMMHDDHREPQGMQDGHGRPVQQQQPRNSGGANLVHNTTRISDLTPKPVLDAKYYRKKLTVYHALVVKPEAVKEEKKDDKKVKFRRSSSGAEQKRPIRWMKVITSDSAIANEDIVKRIKKLDDQRHVTTELAKLAPNQRQQVDVIVNDAINKEQMGEMEWTLAQVERNIERVRPKGHTKQTACMTIYLKRAPHSAVDCKALFNYLQERRLPIVPPPPMNQINLAEANESSQNMRAGGPPGERGPPPPRRRIPIGGGGGGGARTPPVERGRRIRADIPGRGDGNEIIEIIEPGNRRSASRRGRSASRPGRRSTSRPARRPMSRNGMNRSKSRTRLPARRRNQPGGSRSSSSSGSSSSSDGRSSSPDNDRNSDTNTSFDSSSYSDRGFHHQSPHESRRRKESRPRRGLAAAYGVGRDFDARHRRRSDNIHNTYVPDSPRRANRSHERRSEPSRQGRRESFATGIHHMAAVIPLPASHSGSSVGDQYDDYQPLLRTARQRPLVTQSRRSSIFNGVPIRRADAVENEINRLERERLLREAEQDQELAFELQQTRMIERGPRLRDPFAPRRTHDIWGNRFVGDTESHAYRRNPGLHSRLDGTYYD